ncbi:TPA: hypothetical protein ACH3X2_011848 [Trebouxia sp. C0005]
MGVGVLCLPVSLVFSDFLAAVNNVLLHRSRSAQVAKLGMLDMDSVAGHAAMLQEKSAAALTEGKLQDNTGSACAYADRQEGEQKALMEPLRGGINEGNLLNDGNGRDEFDLDAEGDILHSFVNEGFEDEDKDKAPSSAGFWRRQPG